MLPPELRKQLTPTKLPIRAKEKGKYRDTSVYSMPNQNGLYRRVSRDGRAGPTVADGNILAIVPAAKHAGQPADKWGELTRWTEAEQLLRSLLPGVESPNPDQTETF